MSLLSKLSKNKPLSLIIILVLAFIFAKFSQITGFTAKDSTTSSFLSVYVLVLAVILILAVILLYSRHHEDEKN